MYRALKVVRVAASIGCAVLLVVGGAVVVAVFAWDFPEALLGRDEVVSRRIVDRRGVLLRESLSASEGRARWRPLAEISPHLVRATIAAEDHRFYSHVGVDPIAIARAALKAVTGSAPRSGGSTITQQVVKLVRPKPRTLRTKMEEAILAMRLERARSKADILDEYLNRVPYGNQFVGAEAAAWGYFAKPASQLSLAEAALLAVLPRAPSGYNPHRSMERAVGRQRQILALMASRGIISGEERRVAEAEPLDLARIERPLRAPHFVRLVEQEVDAAGAATAEVRTTLDAALQRRVETTVSNTLRDLAGANASNAAVVVLENATGDVLAYVGSADFANAKHKGQVDGARSRRQPGSALKPFVYALAFDVGQLTPASLLPDVEVRYASATADYAPQNFDARFLGPVRVREALANSYNVPAVRALEGVGVARFVEMLRALGVTTLRAAASSYEIGIGLGNNEVTLLDLTAAYAALARGGIPVLPKTIRGKEKHAPQRHRERETGGRVLQETTAALITNILADRHARRASFGDDSVLDLPFRAAVKTGTSSAFRDNWTVGYTREHTVGVWVGDFDGRALAGVSGVTGAAPIWRDVMLALAEMRPREPFRRAPDAVDVVVCPLSGARVGTDCPDRMVEQIPRGHVSRMETCGFHRRVAIDRRNGLAAGTRCDHRHVVVRTIEVYPAPYTEWAVAVGRPLAPTRESPLCAGDGKAASRRAPRGESPQVEVVFPADRDVFSTLPDLSPEDQVIPLRAELGATDVATTRIRFVVNGKAMRDVGPPFVAYLPLAKGHHEVVATADGFTASRPVRFTVR